MKTSERYTSRSLVFNVSEIPFEGVDIATDVRFSDLIEPGQVDSRSEELREVFNYPIELTGSVVPVGSKVDVKGTFKTKANMPCDRCNISVTMPVEGSFSTFLMPSRQFSEHDKPGGKVIHGPTRDSKSSRHHSRTKAPQLTDAEGEHEDISFGAFDGVIVDLRSLVREHMILQLPMKTLCAEDCKGLCVGCGENVNLGLCKCPGGPRLVEVGVDEAEFSPMAQALKAKLGTKT